MWRSSQHGGGKVYYFCWLSLCLSLSPLFFLSDLAIALFVHLKGICATATSLDSPRTQLNSFITWLFAPCLHPHIYPPDLNLNFFFFFNLLVAGRKDVRKGKFGSLGWTCTALFKMDNQQGPTGTLLNIMWQPGWEGSLGENGHVYVYVWLSPFTVHLKSSQHHLLNGYTPVQNKEFWKNEIKFRDTGAHD